MVNEIRADYQALSNLAARFTSRAQATQEVSTSVQRAYEPLEQGSWIGKGADAFFAEMRSEVMPAVSRLIAALTMAGEITDALSQEMQEADNSAATPFRNDLQEERAGGGSGSGSGSGAGGGSGSGSGDSSSGGGSSAETAAETAGAAAESAGSGSGGGSGGGMDAGASIGSDFGSPFAADAFNSDFGVGSFGSSFGTGAYGGDFGVGSFGGGAFGGGYGADALGTGEFGSGMNSGTEAAVSSRFRYQQSGVGTGSGDASFSRPFAGAAMAESAATTGQSGFAVLSSVMAASPFLAAMIGRFGKKRTEE